MLLIIYLLALFVLLLLVDELARRSATAAWTLFLILPLVFSPFWGSAPDFDTFAHIKLYTILLTACWGNALRFTPAGRSRVGLRLFAVMGAVNILEAVVKDALGAMLPHYLNSAAGMLVLVTLFAEGPVLDTAGLLHDLRWRSLTWPWIIAYAVWNWCFVYLNYPVVAGASIATLGAALLIGFIDRDRVAQTRLYTLAAMMILLFAFPSICLVRTSTAHWACPMGELLASAISLGGAVGYTAWLVGTRRALRRGPRMPEVRFHPHA